MTPTAAIIVTYNRLEKLKKCVRLLMESETPCDIIIVNNASTDGTGEWLQAIEQTVPAKFLELNKKAFKLGREA